MQVESRSLWSHNSYRETVLRFARGSLTRIAGAGDKAAAVDHNAFSRNERRAVARREQRETLDLHGVSDPSHGKRGQDGVFGRLPASNMPVSSGVIVEPGQIALTRMFLRATSS